MNTREIIEAYYKYANAGQWDKWCSLFTDDMVMDEQIAGHIEGLDTLREMMTSMNDNYVEFHNTPIHIIVDGNEASSVSHISALATKFPDAPIEAGVMNYFVIKNGRISYMANFHDSKPFKPFLDQFI